MTSSDLLPIDREPAVTTAVTAYGCGPHEAELFREVAARLGVHLTLTDAELDASTVGLARGTRCISVSHRNRITGSTLRLLSRGGVEFVSTRSIGCDHIDLPYAARLGISVSNVSYSPDSVADYTMMLILMAVRRAKATLRRTDAHDYRLPESCGRELRDLTVGVVGTGRIGAAVVDRLRGFGCGILAHDRRPRVPADHVPLDELVARSDVVTLHTPLTADTHHLIDSRRIALMRRGGFVVNTGRGALIDTEALLTALERGHLAGAALDVVEGEEGIFYADHRDDVVPNSTLERLQQLPNVLISPHTGYYTDHALADAVENSLLNCLIFERERHTHV